MSPCAARDRRDRDAGDVAGIAEGTFVHARLSDLDTRMPSPLSQPPAPEIGASNAGGPYRGARDLKGLIAPDHRKRNAVLLVVLGCITGAALAFGIVLLAPMLRRASVITVPPPPPSSPRILANGPCHLLAYWDHELPIHLPQGVPVYANAIVREGSSGGTVNGVPFQGASLDTCDDAETVATLYKSAPSMRLEQEVRAGSTIRLVFLTETERVQVKIWHFAGRAVTSIQFFITAKNTLNDKVAASENAYADEYAALEDVAITSCRSASGPSGEGYADATFDAMGQVVSVTLASSYQGSDRGDCIAKELRKARVFSRQPLPPVPRARRVFFF
jgi:hypothetical protein